MEAQSSLKTGEDYARAFPNLFYRSDAICADGRGNFGADVPDGLVYFQGHYLTLAERAEWVANTPKSAGNEDAQGLGYFNS